MSKSRIVLGLSYGHGDSSSALVINNTLVAAVEEERFSRIKHDALFPKHSIQYCLEHANIKAKDITHIAIPKKPRNALIKKFFLFLKYPHLRNSKKNIENEPQLKKSFQAELSELGIKNFKPIFVEHHLAHLASVAPLCREDASLLSFDGLGDFVSVCWGIKKKEKIEILDRLFFPHSLGYFYTALTQYLGFLHFGDEYKLMGLSSHGQPTYLSQLKTLIRETKEGFHLNLEAFPILEEGMKFSIQNARPVVEPFFRAPFLSSLLGILPRKPKQPLTSEHFNLAKSTQVRFEQIANHLLEILYKKTNIPLLGLSGGCAHNSVWVGNIPSQTSFKEICVAPASSDAGLSVGASVIANKEPIKCEEEHWALLGPSIKELKSEIFEGISLSEAELIQYLARSLSRGEIVGLVRGRMEFGPRALGHRSLLADPRKKEMKEILNSTIKHREWFRPFAASILFEDQKEWFENSFYAPTMEAVFNIKKEKAEKIAAVVHVDGSCRIQSITENQPFYYKLLKEFKKLTGIPLILNTSFNDNEPIVCSTEDALRCFERTKIDHLVIENKILSRIKSVQQKIKTTQEKNIGLIS